MTLSSHNIHELKRWRIEISGLVQGVGFRPFIYRLAREHNLSGWASNTSWGLIIEAEGTPDSLSRFIEHIYSDKPLASRIKNLRHFTIERGDIFGGFSIKESSSGKKISASILPDLATCPECREEIFNPDNRRYMYPFTNCTNCGPRFSIIESLPYDRLNTTMKKFDMCPACRAEYEDPANRRFHAQPNACPQCGPHLELWDSQGEIITSKVAALPTAVSAIKRGQVVAIKGLGGFHLMVDADNDKAVRKLRSRKNREEKPLAIMCRDLNSVKVLCLVNSLEEKLLISPASPIVLLKRRRKVKIDIASSVSPGNPYLGVMLPYTPLHLILMSELNIPVVATSGNLSDEPICIDEQEALKRLGRVADLFLVHNRPIARHADDSVVRIIEGQELVIRRARGYSPLPIAVKKDLPPLLGVGGHLKNSVALAVENDVFLSQHIGDLETPQAEIAFCEVIDHFRNLYERKFSMVACDMHPDYYSTHFARKNGKRIFPVQHHLAHILSCMAENYIDDQVLGISWDGTGYGLDGTIWGGEFLKVERSDWQRVATFRQFPLPGSEKAVQEPRRAAIGLLYEIFSEDLLQTDYIHSIKEFDQDEIAVLLGMIQKNVNTPLTSSVGRLFDAAASLLNIRQINTFEGQAAMEIEFSASDYKTEETYNLNYKSVQVDKGNSLTVIDWEPMFREILRQVENGEPAGLISARFHNTLAKSILEMARRAGIIKIVLSGGCFQNKYLTERVIHILKGNGFEPVWHHLIPPNDGGIALGQIMEAARIINSEAKDVYRDSRTD